MKNNGQPSDDMRALVEATGDVLRKELGRTRTRTKSQTIEYDVPHVEVTVDMDAVAEAITKLAAAMQEQGKILNNLADVLAKPMVVEFNPVFPPPMVEVKPVFQSPTITVTPPEVRVEQPNVVVHPPSVTIEQPARKRRTIRIRHDDGTESVLTED